MIVQNLEIVRKEHKNKKNAMSTSATQNNIEIEIEENLMASYFSPCPVVIWITKFSFEVQEEKSMPQLHKPEYNMERISEPRNKKVNTTTYVQINWHF